MKKSLIIAILTAVALVAGGILFFLGDKYGVEHMSVAYATPTDVAQAMLQDQFYSTYRESTIIVTGTVASVSQTGTSTLVAFRADSIYQALCRFNNPPSGLAAGQRLTVLTEGARAQRQQTAVELENCVVIR